MRFLRRILRQKRLKSYLLYASGELFLIVLGIYIAIQLDNWRESVKLRGIEFNSLQQIKVAIAGDTTDLGGNLEKYKTAIRSCDSVLVLLESKKEIESYQLKYFSGVLLTSYFVTNSGPYEALKSRGLEIIRNDKLRSLLSHYYEGRYRYMQEIESQRTQFVLNVQSKVAIKHFSEVLPYSPENQWFGQYGKMTPDNLNDLRNDKEYIRCIRLIKARTEYYVYQPATITQRIMRKLMKLIDEELRSENSDNSANEF